MEFGRKKPTLRDAGGQILATKSVLLPWFFGYFSGPFDDGTAAIVLRARACEMRPGLPSWPLLIRGFQVRVLEGVPAYPAKFAALTAIEPPAAEAMEGATSGRPWTSYPVFSRRIPEWLGRVTRPRRRELISFLSHVRQKVHHG